MFTLSWLCRPLQKPLIGLAVATYGLSYSALVPLQYAPWLQLFGLGVCLRYAKTEPRYWYALHGSSFLSLYWLAHPLYLMMHLSKLHAHALVALLVGVFTYLKAAPMVWISRRVQNPHLYLGCYWALFEAIQIYFLEFPWILWAQLQGASPLAGLLSPLPTVVWIIPVLLYYACCMRWRVCLLPLGLLFFYSEPVTSFLPINVLVVQGNIDKSLPHRLPLWDRSFYHDAFLQIYQDMSVREDVDLILWPECIFGSVDRRTRQDLRNALPLLKHSTPLLLGASFNEDGYENTAVLLLPGHEPRIRSKQHGALFAEYTPSWLYPLAHYILPMVAPPASAPNTYEVFHLEIRGRVYTLLAIICYESAFLAYENIPESDFIVILSENIWFRSDTAERQQLNFAQLIARRHHRPVVLASNNGITAWIDAYGRIPAQLSSNQPGILHVSSGDN